MNRSATALFVAAAALVCGFAMSCGSKPKAPGTCSTDKDCKDGNVCAANKCVECKTDAQCPTGKKCAANACIAAAECEHDDQCPQGGVCQAGKCKPCASDGECGPGGKCSQGTCQRGKKCGKDEDCADDEDCLNGVCQKAGAGKGTAGANGCVLQTVYFGYDDSSIQASERERLDANSACIEKTPNKQVYLIGHTDSSGTDEYNIALSERRAQSVADYLARLGTDPKRMQVVPKGETEPSGQGDDKDRRCEFQWK